MTLFMHLKLGIHCGSIYRPAGKIIFHGKEIDQENLKTEIITTSFNPVQLKLNE